MKIQAPCIYEKPFDETVAEYTARCLDDRYGESGQLETLTTTCRNIRLSFGRLLEALASKRLLTAPEVTEIVTEVTNFDAKFLE
jgi:hypothetical protein